MHMYDPVYVGTLQTGCLPIGRNGTVLTYPHPVPFTHLDGRVSTPVQIEEPFAILPLELHHKWLLRDARQTQQLMRWSEKRRKQKSTETPS